MSKLLNKVVFITGSSRHTGYGIAEQCTKEGAYAVIINGTKKEEVKKAADSLRKKSKSKIIEAPGDISSENEVEAIFQIIKEEVGKLDILIHNACHLGLGPGFIDVPLTLWDEVLAVNVRGMFLCGQQAARMMQAQGGGTIINIGSVQGIRAARNRSAYITSKGAIEACTKAMAIDLAEYNIRVNMVVPGYIHTSRWNDLNQEVISTRRSNIPLHKEADYEDISNAVIFLASDDSKNITGSSLVVDGGLTTQLLPDGLDI